MSDTDRIFDKDEMTMLAVRPGWTVEGLLGQTGVYFLKDLAKPLGVSSMKIKSLARAVGAAGKDPWVEIGVRKVWNHWLIRMKVFAPYYREHLVPRTREVEPGWTGNDLIAQQGLFLLTDVCRLIPFSAHQIRHQSKKLQDPREVMGVWKDVDLKGYLVEMAVFGPWVKTRWESF